MGPSMAMRGLGQPLGIQNQATNISAQLIAQMLAQQADSWQGRPGQILRHPNQDCVSIMKGVTPEVKTMSYVKEYFVKHRELLMGLVVIALIDHYFFKNALKEKLQKIAHNFLDNADKKLTEQK